MTELNSILHEYTYDTNYDSTGKTILDQPEANIVLNAAMKACYPKVGLMLDYRACEEKFNLNSVECSASLKTNCFTAAQVAAVRKVWTGTVDASPHGCSTSPLKRTSARLPLRTRSSPPCSSRRSSSWPVLGCDQPRPYDGLGAVVSWTEKHVSPDALVATEYASAAGGGPGGGSSTRRPDRRGAHAGAPATTAVVRSINIYPHPELPAYKGLRECQ